MKSAQQHFHGGKDFNFSPGKTFTVEQAIADGSLSYRFYPHFHPYVLDLIRRLNQGSVTGLEAADTDYQLNSDGSTTTLPNSTRAKLIVSVQATRLSDGTSVTLLPGALLELLDGTVVTLADNTNVLQLDGTPAAISPSIQVTLPQSIPSSFSSGTQMSPGGGSTFILPEETPVTLTKITQASLSDGTRLTLPASTQIGLRSGVPLPKLYQAIFTSTAYEPNTDVVQQPWPVKDLDFTLSGAYSLYNWELFFHIPLLISIHLSQNQQFKDAQKWFHYIFDPTDDSNGPTPQRFWKVNPFQFTEVEKIEQILLNLSTPYPFDPQLKNDTINSIDTWQANPFQPFVVGRYRPTAFMLKTVMAYLDNLIAWGDTLFQQYTIETINEATQLYVLAANILGRRPQAVPKKGAVGPRTYAELRASLDSFSNALVDMEVDIPFNLAPGPGPANSNAGGETLSSIGQSLYFCIPRNDKLLAYWDTVADRLFKIHNSLNLQGVFQQLPLFDPPIDPALLVRAAAAGLNVSAIVSGLNQPLPLVRFNLLVGKATEICQEVKSLGNGLLSAMEKHDNEAMVLLRAQHETIILGLAKMIKYSQWQEAVKAKEGLLKSLANTAQRYTFYQKQLGMQENQINIPALDDLDENSLEAFSFQASEPEMQIQTITVDISKDSASLSDGEIKTLSRHEVEELKKLESGRDSQETATGLESLASGLGVIPQFGTKAHPVGVGGSVGFGGQQLHSLVSGFAAVARMFAEEYAYEANKTAKLGSYSRRELDWTHQSNLAAGEINQIFKQLRAAQIREAITKKEYDNHTTQVQQAQDIENFLQGQKLPGLQIKETTTDFYLWMKRQVKALYNQGFELAFSVAKKAERALQAELGDSTQSYIQVGYLDGVEGLFAGEKLLLDVKRMEMAYHELNRREYELTKHVSLLQVAPFALMELRATGSCTVSLPEDIFDLDGPGHYFRRIKSVAVTLPCVTGPYTGVNCMLTLLNSSIRRSSQLGDRGYPRDGSDDPRFSDSYGTVQAVVTSSGQMDSGLFETNLHDERYLPFELAGAISQWRLNLPFDVKQFDFDTIADVVLHLRYTAREGGDPLKGSAVENLQTRIKNAEAAGSVRLFSVRHEFPTEWAKFKSAKVGANAPAGLLLNLQPEHYPYWSQTTATLKLIRLTMFAETKAPNVDLFSDSAGTAANGVLKTGPSYGELLDGDVTIPPPAAIGELKVYLSDNSMKNLWMAITWSKP